MRESGFYWIKIKRTEEMGYFIYDPGLKLNSTCWIIAYYTPCVWFLPYDENGYVDNDFIEINENRIIHNN